MAGNKPMYFVICSNLHNYLLVHWALFVVINLFYHVPFTLKFVHMPSYVIIDSNYLL